MHSFFTTLQVLIASFMVYGTVLNVRKLYTFPNDPSINVGQVILAHFRQSIVGRNFKGVPLRLIRTVAMIVACWLIGAPILAIVITACYLTQAASALYLYLVLCALENFARV